MRLLISDEQDIFEAPTVWLTEDIVPTVGKQHLFSISCDYEKEQEGPYNWIKIAILDTVQIDLTEGCMVWLPTVYERQGYVGTWNSIHTFVECGLLHNRQQGKNCDTSASMMETSEASADYRSSVVSEGLKLTGIKNYSCFSIDDFEELLDRAANVLNCFKNNSLKDDKLCDAIFGLLYVYILPFIPILPSDKVVISQVANYIGSLLLSPSCEDNNATAVQICRELAKSEQNRQRMLLRMLECSNKVLNNQVTNYFLFAENDESNNRFSFNISFGSRSLREIIIVTVRRNYEASEQIKNLGKKLLSKIQLNYEADQNEINDIVNDNSSLFGSDNTWWYDIIEKLVKTVYYEALGINKNWDQNSSICKKISLICLDIALSTVYDQYLFFFSKKCSFVTESLSRVCHTPAASERINEVCTKIMVKNDVNRTSNDGNDILVPTKLHVANIYNNLEALIKTKSLLAKGRFLVNVIDNVEQMIRLFSRESRGVDGLLDNILIILLMFDSQLCVNVKVISDFCLFAMPNDHGRLSCMITNFIAAYGYLLSQSVEEKFDNRSSGGENVWFTSNDASHHDVIMRAQDEHNKYELLLTSMQIEYDKQREHMADAWKEFINQYYQWKDIRRNCISSLKEVAEIIQKTSFDTNVANITASSAGIISGVVGIVGLALIPFTAGISSALIIGSIVGGGASALTSGGALIAKSVILSKQGKRAQDYCNRNREASEKLLRSLNRFNELKEKYFQSLLGHDQKQRSISRSGRETMERMQHISAISRTVSSSVSPLRAVPLFRVGSIFAESAEAATSTLGNAFKVVRIAGIAISSVFIVLDTWSLVMSVIDTHKGSKTELYNSILSIVSNLEAESQYYSTALKFCEDIRIDCLLVHEATELKFNVR